MIVFIDFETFLINNESPIPKPVCLSFHNVNSSGLLTGKDIEKFLIECFSDNNISIGAHNAAFELNVITKYYPTLKPFVYNKLKENKIICTKVYEQLLNCRRKKQQDKVSLDSLVFKYFNKDISEGKKDTDSWRFRYHELVDIPLGDWPKDAIDYAIDDSIYAYDIYHEQIKEADIDCSISVAADYFLNRMGVTGILIDQDRVSQIEMELKEQSKPYIEFLQKKGILVEGKKGLKRNMKYFKELLQKDIPDIKHTIKGSVSTSSEDMFYYLNNLSKDSETYKIVNSFTEIMATEKVITAFVSRLKKASPYIRTQYKSVVNSGRTSSFTSNNFPSVNIQQMPREVKNVTWDIRNCFIPRDGYKLCSMDYSGLELASTANQLYKITGKRNMLDILNQGDCPVDPHSMLAYRFINIKENAHETYHSFLSHKKEPKYKRYRQLAKPINLGFPGGLGQDTMRMLLAKDKIYPKLKVLASAHHEDYLQGKMNVLRKKGHPVRIRRVARNKYELIYDELVALKEELFNLYPDLKYFLNEGHKQFLTGETKRLKNEFGEWEQEEMYSFQVGDFHRDWCTYTQLCNGVLMQSPSAIGAKRALINTMETFADTHDIIPLAFIHDEILFEVKESNNMYSLVQDVAEIMLRSMRTILTDVRIAVEAEIMDYWMKSGGIWGKSYWLNPDSNVIHTT